METENRSPGMDDFTRRYLYLLGALILIGLIWWASSLDSRVGELNELLEEDAELAAYPYTFRVLSLANGVAEISSPRSAEVSAIQGLRIMFPELRDAGVQSARMVAAQERLGRTQSLAGKIVAAQEDVQRVRWVLDRSWLVSNGAYLE